MCCSAHKHGQVFQSTLKGDELYVFGSNKNLSLGVGDEDDRQFPERIQLRRPDGLVQRIYEAYCDEHSMDTLEVPIDLDDIPVLVQSHPLVIKDMVMSKLHSAILTTDPVSNLYICGVGRGGRLGLGDENTQFRFVPVQGPLADKNVEQVALGQNHTLAIAGNGELWTWGLNTDSQLGYVLPPPTKVDEEPMCVTPRQVFGLLKKDIVLGVAASAIHSVAHTGASLYCWGRNTGQLALMDSDSRSLDIQQTPRKVAASLLSATIKMVSAIDKATTCLLSNHTVWVFTNYGYNLVKLPIPDVFANYNMNASYSNRYESGRKEIAFVTSGGDTIAAVTARGDLFTMQMNQKVEASQPATSTTNPVKIKGALTQPQCIWDSRKDGVVSVNVGEHGSVIICTESGAVWKRVKRLKGKSAAFAGSTDFKRKDFKFERVPYITNCVAARSSTFGAFAAIRTDSKVMSEEIKVQGQSVWEDIGSLMCLGDFEAFRIPDNKLSRKAWGSAIAKERKGSVPHEILSSADIEVDLLQWLQMNSFLYEDADLEIRSSSAPDVRIPVHGFVLAGRSSVLRDAFDEFRELRISPDSEVFTLEEVEHKMVLTLVNADIFTMLNIVVYIYQDVMIPVWKYTRESPPQAYRFRQVRTELMKFATKLNLPKLEAAARLQIGLERSMDLDLQQAIKDPRYFEDGDVIIELDGAEALAHSQLLCQRCPFFQGMFHGRSRGQWLASRRNDLGDGDRVRVDLTHISPDTFHYVLAFLYGDVGTDMFDDVVAASIDEFSELALDVMAAANELMLDRLAQTCQYLIGKFVTTRNIANLLNEINPCSVTDFKDTGLEYICLQLESMLENHLLEDLDEDLLHDLDEVIRDNQLSRFPFARSGRAEFLLHEKYPDLATEIEEERRIRIKELAYKVSQKDEDKKLSSSYRMRVGSLDEMASSSPTADRSRRKSKVGRNEPFSPSLRPKSSVADMIFDMEDDPTMIGGLASPDLKGGDGKIDLDRELMPQLPKSWQQSKGKEHQSLDSPISSIPVPESMSPLTKAQEARDVATPGGQGGNPWASRALQTSRLDLKGIMSEATSKSALSAGLAAQQTNGTNASKPQTKISQKERKKQAQLQAEAEATEQEQKASRVPWERVPPGGRPAPWKAASPAPKTSLKDAMSSESASWGAVETNAKPLVASEASSKLSKLTKVRTASPDTRFPGQGRASSSSDVPTATSNEREQKPLVPHSKSYITPTRKVDEPFGASMADIIGQQAREQQLAKEAVAKRSLQEIQQEQEFQQWWDQESRRAQEEEARRQAKGKQQDGKTGQRGRRGRGSNKTRTTESGTAPAQAEGGSVGKGGGSSHRGRGVRGRGRKAKIVTGD